MSDYHDLDTCEHGLSAALCAGPGHYPADDPYAPAATMSDAAREYHAQGLPCPFDCYACEARAMQHSHPCIACAAPVDCYDECYEPDDVTPGVRCAAHALPPLVWHGPERDPAEGWW